MISRDILGGLIDGERRNGHLNVDSCQKDARICADEEGELNSQTHTHTNVVLGGIGAKPELTCSSAKPLRANLTRCPQTGGGYSKSLCTALMTLRYDWSDFALIVPASKR